MLAEHLPDPEKLKQMIGELLEMETEVSQGKVLQLNTTEDPMVVAAYENDEDKVAGLCLCDVQAVNRLGAALSMIPVEVANKNIEAHQVTDEVMSNLNDLMDMISQFLKNPHLPGLKLKAILSSSETLSEGITALAKDPAARLDLEVKLQNYGPGYLSILLDDMPIAASGTNQA